MSWSACGRRRTVAWPCGARRKGFALPEWTACAVDALFGTGLSRPLEGAARAACEALNALAEAGVPVVAVDIPSGLNGETGQVMGAAVRACETVTFHRPKPGLYLGQGPDCAGEITVADIGLTAPEAAALDDADGMRVLERGERLLPPRAKTAHKGSFGRVVLWAGSRGMAGAAAIAATAALRAGAGLVTVACPDDVVDVVQTLCPCATCAPLPMDDEDAAWEALSAALERADAMGAGCGLGQGPMAAALMERLLRFLHGRALPCVLDADALNLLARRPAWLADGAAIVLTPHPGEAARLLGVSTAEILADVPGAAVRIRRPVWRGGGAQGCAQCAVCGGGPGPQPLRHARHGQGRQWRRAHRRDGGAVGRAHGGRIRDGRSVSDAGGVRPARTGGRAGRGALR